MSLTEAQIQAAADAGASDREVEELAELKTRAQEFEAARSWLESIGPRVYAIGDAALVSQYESLLSRATTIRNRVQSVTNAIDQAWRWARETVGLGGVRQLSGLGLVWFIPAAVIAGSTAVIGYWLRDFLKFRERFVQLETVADRLKEQGMDPAEAERQAASIVAQTAGRGWLGYFAGDMGKVFGVGVIALGALYWWNNRQRPPTRRRRRRRA